jgi:hypothetical protein
MQVAWPTDAKQQMSKQGCAVHHSFFDEHIQAGARNVVSTDHLIWFWRD